MRTPLSKRTLPDYTKGEDIANAVTHIVGGAIGIAVLVFSVLISVKHNNVWGIVSGSVFGASMVILYAVSATYHGLKPNYAKKVMQVIDHCTIYFLIGGTYTPILLSSVRNSNAVVAWVIFGIVWGLSVIGTVFSAIDHKKYSKLEISLYIAIGWCIVFALRPTVSAIGKDGFLWLLAGGIAYSVGAVLYVLGAKHRYFHTVFHVFVCIGSVLQSICVLRYCL